MRYIRDRFELFDEGLKNDRRAAVGVQIPLGRRTIERIVEREVVREQRRTRRTVPAQIVDSDNDGVPDQNDACPGTLAGSRDRQPRLRVHEPASRCASKA